jgi:predicted KAP-like P-loop ATPase
MPIAMGTNDPTQNPSQWLSADRPIETRQEDELDRRGFSETLADAIRGWTGRDSLVIALYGAWGNGKSSIKNMVVESLGQGSPIVRCVDFNPWQLANRPSLGAAFFDELGVALGKSDLGTNSQRKSALNKYRRWAQRLQGVGDLAKATRTMVGLLLILFGFLTVGSVWKFSAALSVTLAMLSFFMAFIAFTTGSVEALVKIFAAGTEIGEKSLSEIKGGIAADLRKLKTPILIALDDLDRLTPQETLEVFQLIKANGDFPNVIYLILCDRKVVEDSITRALSVSGRDYLEKIVQVAFDVPMINIERVRQVLFSRLNSLLAAESVSNRFVQKRWANIFLSSLNYYFTTLRDVNRFISTLAFQISAFTIEGAFEVNPVDLIVLEVIRLYEPEVYNALKSSKDILTNSKPGGRTAETTKAALNAIVELGSEDHRDALSELLQHLFPNAEWAFGGSIYAQDYGKQWYRDLRVCSPKLFDRYFRLAVSDEELSQAVVQKLLGARGDRGLLRLQLESLSAQQRLITALEELAVFQDELEPKQVEPFITAIFDVGDLLSETRSAGFEIPIQWRVSFLVQHALEKLSDLDARAHAFENAVRDATGLSMVAEVVAVLTTKSAGETKELILPEEKAAGVRAVALRKIVSAAASGRLEESPSLGKLLHLWRAWGNAEDVVACTERITSVPEGLMRFLKSMELRSVMQQAGDYVGSEKYYFQKGDIEPLISIETLGERVAALPKESIDGDRRRAIDNFLKAIDRWRLGKHDGPPFFED